MNSEARSRGIGWGAVLVFLGLAGLINTLFDLTALTWVVMLAVAGLAGLIFYLIMRRPRQLLLIPYIMWAVAGLVALTESDVLRDEATAGYVLTAVALPFLATYLLDRTRRWPLIPAYILLAVGLMVVLLEDVLTDALVPAYVMFAIAIPFLVSYLRDRQKWGALIVGGILAIIGLAFLIAEAAVEYVVPVILIIAGASMLVRQFGRSESGELTAEKEPPPAG